MSEPASNSSGRNSGAQDPSTAYLSSLIAEFRSKNSHTRLLARQKVVAVGEAALGPLIVATTDANEHVRWEAVKALGEICDPRAASAFVDSLEDDSFGVRWLAADGLITLRKAGLVPLLQALIDRPTSGLLRVGAYHVLRVLAGHGFTDALTGVVSALQSNNPLALEANDPILVKVQLAAAESLRRLES